MSMTKVIITSNDPLVDCVYSSDKAKDLFGEDYLEEYGIEIPSWLLEKYQKNYDEFWKIQEEIKEYSKLSS